MNRSLALLPFLLCLVLLVASIETDISVPGFPDMVRYFGATEAQIQLTMSINFLGFCLACLILGPLSDSYGRRPVMLLGMVIFLLAAIGTVTATSLPLLIVWRFFQGVGAGTETLFIAMIADAYQGERASRLLTRLNAVLTAAMAGAPIAGGMLVESFGWRSTYSSVALLCLVTTPLIALFLPETNHNKQPFVLKEILRNFRQLITSQDFLLLTMIPTILCTGYLIYVGSAVFFYIDQLGVDLRAFTIHQGCVIGCFSLVSFLAGHINSKIGASNAVIAGALLTAFGALCLSISAGLSVTLPSAYTVGMCLYATGVALAYAPIFTGSMELYPNLRGVASSMGMSLRLLMVSAGIWIAGMLYDGTFIPIASLILATAMISSVLIVAVLARPSLRKLLA